MRFAKTVIIIDDSKLSQRLGERHAIPIELLAFAVVLMSYRSARAEGWRGGSPASAGI
jgi:ribose 5-phosphate isomerase